MEELLCLRSRFWVSIFSDLLHKIVHYYTVGRLLILCVCFANWTGTCVIDHRKNEVRDLERVEFPKLQLYHMRSGG